MKKILLIIILFSVYNIVNANEFKELSLLKERNNSNLNYKNLGLSYSSYRSSGFNLDLNVAAPAIVLGLVGIGATVISYYHRSWGHYWIIPLVFTVSVETLFIYDKVKYR